jgi:hypothetical protein
VEAGGGAKAIRGCFYLFFLPAVLPLGERLLGEECKIKNKEYRIST